MSSKDRSFTGNEARRLLRGARTGTLASLNREGGIPYASLVNVATDVRGWPLILISTLAWHTRNLLADGRASLLVAEPPSRGDALTGPRVTVMGRFVQTGDAGHRRRYLARHPEAAMYAGFGDFNLWRLEPDSIHAVAGFGRIETLPANEVFPSADAMESIEESAIIHMNQDHLDAVQQYVGDPSEPDAEAWRVTAIDTDGFETGQGTEVRRVDFSEPVYAADALRRAFARLGGRPGI